MLPHVYIGPIQDLCRLEYRPHMGKTCGIHIGNENGSYMGFIWDSIWDPCLSQIHYTCFPCGSHILPMWIPHECQMFPRWLSRKSWFNPWFPGCILWMFSVFLWCMPVCDRQTAEMANNEIVVAVTKPCDRDKSGLPEKVAESTRSHNHRHREPIGNGGFFSLVCSFSLHSRERERKRSPCLWTRNAGQWKVPQCRIVIGSASLFMGYLM